MFNQIQKLKPWRSESYKSFVRSHYCCCCMMPKTIAHHIRTADNSGTGTKPSDFYCVPLCHDHHAEIHQTGVKTFCEKHGIDIYRVLHKLTSEYMEGIK